MRIRVTGTIALTPLATRLHRLGAVVLLAGVLAFPATPAGAHRGTTTRVSVDSAGNEGIPGQPSEFPSLSANGRFVAFESVVNLAPGGGGGQGIFVHDRHTGTTTRVSVDSAGNGGNGFSCCSSISATGRFVAFESDADNLVPGDTNQTGEVFLRDRRTGTTHRVAVSTRGAEANRFSSGAAVSDDGRYVAFQSPADNLGAGDINRLSDVFVRDRRAGTTIRASVDRRGGSSNGESSGASISADGRYLMFSSEASNLVAGDTNGVSDVFLRDLREGTTARVSVRTDGAQVTNRSLGSAISGNGRFVLFESTASDLVPSDTNGASDVFVKDMRTGRVDLVSRTLSGGQFTGHLALTQSAISADGRRVAFDVTAQDAPPWYETQVYLRDRAQGRTILISAGRHGRPCETGARLGGISGNGRYVVFDTWSPDVPPVVPPSNRVVVRDLATGRNILASLDSQGRPIPFASHYPIATNGGVAFFSMVANVVPGVPILGQMPPPPPAPPPPPGAPPVPMPPSPQPGLMATAGHVYFHEF
jgi:Tol biopolymer transport system component